MTSGSTGALGESGWAMAQNHNDDEMVAVRVVNKNVFNGKTSGSVRFEDVDKVLGEIVRLEEGINRVLRHVNRKANRALSNISQLSGEVNTGFRTLTTQIETCAERVDTVAQTNHANRQRRDSSLDSNPSLDLNPSADFPANQAENEDGLDDGHNIADQTLQWDETPFQRVNMLTDGPPIPLEVYRDDCVITYDRWAKRFREHMEAYGRKLDEKEKLARLVIYLDGIPKRLIEKMEDAKKMTIGMALTNLRAELDSPQSKSLSRQALLACRQSDGESVKDFLNRFIPLAEAAVAGVIDADQKEAQLREMLLDRLRPNISLVMKMLDLSRDKQFEQLCWEAREVEIMMSAQSSGMPFLQNERVIHAVEQESMQNPSTPSGRFQTLTPTRQDRFSSNNYEPNRRNQTPGPQQRFRQKFDNRNQQSQYRNQRPPNDRRWNNRPVCNYCKKVGHVANACRTRLADFQNNQRPQSFNQRAKSDRWSTTPFASGANAVHQDQTLSLLHEIARTMNKLTVNTDQPGRRDDVNTIATSTEQCHVKKVHIKDKSDISKSEPLQVSSWEKATLGPKIHPFIFIVAIFCTCGPVFSNTAMIPQGPMLCQTETQPTLWKLPEIPECPIPKVTVGHVPISQIRELYIPNAIEHNTKAWACRKIIKRARKFTPLSGVPITEALSSVMLDVSVDECKQMIEHRSCIFGILTEIDGLWGTSNPIDLTPRFWFIGSFSWYEVNSKNCFAFETVVSSHFGDTNIKSPIGTRPNCHYGNGNCTLNDKTMLLWTPEKSTNCRYTFVAKYKGHYVNNSWLSEDAEYGLHFKQPTPKVSDCGLKLQLSEQGFATRVLSNSNTRSKRSYSGEGLGLTTSIELNARLTYLDNEWADAMMYAFRQSFKASCDFMVTTRRWAAAAYLVDPISLARMLFNNTKLYAVRSGSSILKIWPCILIRNGEYRFKPTQIDDLCFERLPIEFKTQAKNELAFLDPSTMIIHTDSKKASCSTHRKIIIQLNDKAFEVDQVSGETETLEVQIFNSELRLKQISEIERHSFHQRALINLTDLNTHAFVSGMIKASAITYKISEENSIIKASVSEQWTQVADELKKKVVGDYRLTWLTLLTILVAVLILDFTLRYAPVLLECYVGNGRLARIIFGRRKPKQDIEETYQVNEFPLSDMVQTHEILEARGDPTNWPPSVSSFPPTFASSDPQNSRPMGRLQTLRKSLKSRKRSKSSPSNAQGRIAGTSATTSIMVLTACISLLPQTEAVDHQDEMRTSLLDWWVALIPAFCVYLILFVALYCLKYLLHNRKEAKASYLTWNEVVSEVNTLHPYMATVRAFVNNKPVCSLMDTGASVTLAPISLAQDLNCHLYPTNERVISASGHLIDVRAKALMHIEVANCKIYTEVKLVNDDGAAKRKNYQLIIGCDAMKKMPPVTFDIANAKLHILNGSTDIGAERDWLFSDVKVVCNVSTDLPPGHCKVIEGKLLSFCDLNQVLVHDLDRRLKQQNIGFIPTVSVSNNGHIKLVLTNPTFAPVRLYKGMQIASVNQLRLSDEGPWLTEQIDHSVCAVGHSVGEVDPSFCIDFSKSSATGDDLTKLRKLCDEFSDIFSKSQYDLGSCLVGEHDIVTKTEEPVASKPRRTPFRFREEVKSHLDKWIKAGVMVKSDTPWVSNLVLVQKKDGGLRPCIDFRKLNEVTIPDHYPLPRLEMILEKIGKCHWYSSLDLSSGYLQIRLTDRASRKCGIITEDEIFQMTHMPFGLRNATSAFARVMAHVLTGLEDTVIAYVDDFLIYTRSPNLDDHLSALRQVFLRLRQYNLRVSPKKCVLASSQMEFLGFVINEHGYTPSLGKVEIIKELPAPTSVKEVRRIIGMASFFRKHILGFSTLVEPLTRLTRKEVPFVWEAEQQDVFNKIKSILCDKPVLRFPDYQKPFHIFTDASNVGQGGALMQKDNDKAPFHAVAYCSRTLSTAERKWPTVQIELGSIIFALRQFRPFIYMGNVELHTDHKPLAYLLQKADAHPNLARWLIELQNYNIKIVHVAGKQNSLADALSRAAHENLSEEEVKNLSELKDVAEFPACLVLSSESRLVLDESINALTLRSDDGKSYVINMRHEQQIDIEASAFIEFLKSGEIPDGLSDLEKEKFAATASKMLIDSELLVHQESGLRPRIFVPVSLRALVFDSFHSSPLGGGHMNLKKTLKKCRKYFWPRMHADIVNWTRTCITCQLRHSPVPAYRAEMKMPPVNTLFAKVGLDLAGPFPVTKRGNKHIMNVVCWFTKFVISVPVPDAKSTTLVNAFLTNCYLKFGGCTELITDNAAAFTSEFFREFCAMLYISKRYAIPHWSQGNASTERTFRTFHNILSKYISKDQPDFDEHLEAATFCYNTAVHQSTGETPFFLMYGRDPIFCVDQILDPRTADPVAFTDLTEFKYRLINSLRMAWAATAEEIRESQMRAKAQYDKQNRVLDIQVGDRVLLKNYISKVGTSKKFHLPWRGIFRVVNIDGVKVTITSCNAPQANPRVVHINQLKKSFDGLGPACTVPELTENEKDALLGAQAEELQNQPGYSHTPNPNPDFASSENPQVLSDSNDTTETSEKAANPKPSYGLRNRMSLRRPHKFD